jgi:SAM-dependent methyltransferase
MVGRALREPALVSDHAPLRGHGPAGFDPARVLDVCCGSRMFWFSGDDPDALYVDNRVETHSLADRSSQGGSRSLVIDPDIVADFTALPFDDDTFPLVVFDPPHLVRNGRSGWLAKKYGKLGANWRDDLRDGFAECFRVLRPDGTLIFKWNEHEIKVSEVLKLTPVQPLFGNRCGKTAKSHWIVFMKPRKSDGRRMAETAGLGAEPDQRGAAEERHSPSLIPGDSPTMPPGLVQNLLHASPIADEGRHDHA